MALINIGKERYIAAEEIIFVADIDKINEKTYLDRLKSEEAILYVNGRNIIRSVIITKNGLAIYSNLHASTVEKRVKGEEDASDDDLIP